MKLKLFEYRQGLNIEQADVVSIISEHIDLCDQYSEKEIFNSLTGLLDTYKFYESVTPFLNEIDEELSGNPLLYNLKDLYAKVARLDQAWLYESALHSIIECINASNDEDRKIKILDSLKLYEWVPAIKNFLFETASTPQTKQNFLSKGGKIDDVHSIVLQLKEGYLTYVANKWFLMSNEGVASVLLEDYIKDDIQLKKMRLLEQAIQHSVIEDNKMIFQIAEELKVSFDFKTKEIKLNESEADKGTTLETLFNSSIIPFVGKAFYPVLNEAFNNLDKFMKIDTVKHIYNVANNAFECYVFNFNNKISQYRIDKHSGTSYYSYDNAMPLIESVMHELGADLTFFYEELLSDEVKARVNVENQEKALTEKLADIDNAILTIKNEGVEIIKENKSIENLYNSLLVKRHKTSEELKSVKNQKSELYK